VYNSLGVARIVSEPHPLTGEQHRSSDDFDLSCSSSHPSGLFWIIEDQEEAEYDTNTIMFDIMGDESGKDEVIWQHMHSGQETEVIDRKNLYVANPRRADGGGSLPDNYTNFTIGVYVEIKS